MDTEVTIQLASRLGPLFTNTYYAAVVKESALFGDSVTRVAALSATPSTLIYRILSLGPEYTESSLQDCPFYLEYETGASFLHLLLICTSHIYGLLKTKKDIM